MFVVHLNASKTELIWFRLKHLLNKVTENDLTPRLHSGRDHPVRVVRDVGVMLDSELSMKKHVTEIASSCFTILAD